MKRFLMMMFAAITLLTCNSCSETKESYVKDFTKFIEKVQKESEKYTSADWEKVDKTFQEFAVTKYDKYSPELTTDEMFELTKLKAEYITIQTKHGINIGINKAIKEGKKAIDGLVK